MNEINMKDAEAKNVAFQPQEEFIRQVIFMKDEDRILAVFPFFHNISEREYEIVVGNFFNETPPPKREFCLMHESDFGWGWIHNQMIQRLELAYENDYEDFKNMLISNRVIKDTFILNEE